MYTQVKLTNLLGNNTIFINQSNTTLSHDTVNNYWIATPINSSLGECYFISSNNINYLKAHKYYCSVDVKGTADGYAQIYFPYLPPYLSTGQAVNTTWKRIAFISDSTAYGDIENNSNPIRFDNDNATVNRTNYYKQFMLIDLTASFGAGNEPTKEWCDSNIQYFNGDCYIMYGNASTDFQNKMVQAYRPGMDIEVEYGQIDPDARDTASVNDKSAEMVFSNANQVVGENQNKENIKIATLENREILLDGSFEFAPETSITDREIGFRPTVLSDSIGNFATQPYIKITTTNIISAAGLTITFSPLLGQYATDFDVYVGDTVHSISGNQKIRWCSDFTVEGVNNVNVVIKKWSKGLTRAKITQIDFGFYLTLTADELTSFRMSETFNPISTQLSDGTITFDFLNIDKKYNPFNLGAQQRFIVDRQPITTKAGYKDEMYQIGYHELSGKPKIESSTIQLTGYTLINKLNKQLETTLYENKNIKYIAENILARCGVQKYSVDSGLTDTITTIVTGNAKDVISSLLIAYCKQIWQYGDTLYIGNKTTNNSGFNITSNVEQQPTINTDNQINKISVKYYTYNHSTVLEELTSYKSTEIGTVVINTDYASGMVLSGETSHATLVGSTIDSATVNFTSAEKEIKVNGYKYKKVELSAVKNNNNSQGIDIEIGDNQFIQSSAQANAVLNWINKYYSNKNIIDTKWRQNPIVQLGDIIGVDTDFGNQNIIVESNIYEYKQGGLSGQTKGRCI